VQDGKVTAKGLEELRQRMPFAGLSEFETNPVLSHIGNLFTVELIVRYIEGKVGVGRSREAAPPVPLTPPERGTVCTGSYRPGGGTERPAYAVVGHARKMSSVPP
jgi:hypothetical protein